MTKKNRINIKVSLRRKSPYQLLLDCMEHKIAIRGSPDNIERILNYRKYPGSVYKPTDSYYARKYLNKFLLSIGKLKQQSDIVNTTDFSTCGDISSILPEFYFEMGSSTVGLAYACDIRSLCDYYTHADDITPQNPYNGLPLSALDYERLQRKIRWLKKYRYSITYENPSQQVAELSTKQLTTNVFVNISKYQYVCPSWFDELQFEELRQLYLELADIWDYRLNLDDEQRRQIIPDSICCPNSNNIRRYTYDMIDKLRRELLHNINKLVSSGVSEDDRFRGSTYFMLAFVLVSEPAADCNPTLFQSAFYSDDD